MKVIFRLMGLTRPMKKEMRYWEERGVPYLNDVLDLYLHRSLTGELEPEEALKMAGEEWDRISERQGTRSSWKYGKLYTGHGRRPDINRPKRFLPY